MLLVGWSIIQIIPTIQATDPNAGAQSLQIEVDGRINSPSFASVEDLRSCWLLEDAPEYAVLLLPLEVLNRLRGWASFIDLFLVPHFHRCADYFLSKSKCFR